MKRPNRKIHRDRKVSGCQGLEWGRRVVRKMLNVLEVDAMTVVQPYEYIKNHRVDFVLCELIPILNI